jgi:hypothetical protein
VRVLWDAIEDLGPDMVLDFHTSSGIYGRSPSGVGQAVFRSHSRRAARRTGGAVWETNNRFDLSEWLEFKVRPMSYSETGPDDLLVEKTALDLGAGSYLAETYRGLGFEDQVDQLEYLCLEFLDEADIIARD